MRISELARRSDVSIATVKFYLRQGLLPAGNPTSPTNADYGSEHVERVRLVRALVDVGGLALSDVRNILASLDAGGIRAGTSGAAAAGPASVGTSARTTAGAAAGAAGKRPARKSTRKAGKGTPARALRAAQDTLPPHPPNFGVTVRADAAVSVLGWKVDAGSTALRQLEAALIALDTVGLPPSVSTLMAYAEAALQAARSDVAAVPAGTTDEVVRHVMLAGAMYEPLLVALHRLAQQHAFAGG